jgi:hypothetical protein
MREYLDHYTLSASIQMQRTQDARIVLLVEGDTDARFFERFVDHERCFVISAHDRERAISLLRLLNQIPLDGVVAILDADFGRVTGTLESDGNVFFCDGHDLEIMLLRSPAIDRLTTEFASREKLDEFLKRRCPFASLAAFLAQACVPIGLLMLLSMQQKLSLTFKTISFSDFFDHADLTIDVERLITHVMNKSQKHDEKTANQLRLDLEKSLQHSVDAWEVARGHDCVELLALLLRSVIGTKKSKTDQRASQTIDSSLLEKILRLTFSESDFHETDLAQSISSWERKNPSQRFLMRKSNT